MELPSLVRTVDEERDEVKAAAAEENVLKLWPLYFKDILATVRLKLE